MVSCNGILVSLYNIYKAKGVSMSVQDFKQAHKKFTEGLRYIVLNEEKLKADPVKWARIKKNFESKFEQPMDAAWKTLTDEEKKPLLSVYLHRKAQMDPTVKKVMEPFDAEISSVWEAE